LFGKHKGPHVTQPPKNDEGKEKILLQAYSKVRTSLRKKYRFAK
jgi:hypothetical protein